MPPESTSRDPIVVGDHSFAPSQFWCLHVARFATSGASSEVETKTSYSQMEWLCQLLADRFQTDQVNGVFATVASINTVRGRFFRKPTVVDWLTQNSGLTPTEAADAIRDFPIPVNLSLNQNARNPLQFLGFAAAVAQQPNVIVYGTSGMDPRGRSLLHGYAAERYSTGCLISLSPCDFTGGACIPSGVCRVVDVNLDEHEIQTLR